MHSLFEIAVKSLSRSPTWQKGGTSAEGPARAVVLAVCHYCLLIALEGWKRVV